MARLPVLWRAFVLLGVVTFALSVQGCGQGEDQGNDGRQEEVAARVELMDSLRNLLDSGRVPGVQVATVEDGRLALWFGTGLADADEESPVLQGTIFEAASLSKPVAAYIAFRLVDRGELDLDTPLWDILEYPRLAHDPRAREITPRMVLSHTTGLPNWGDTPLELIRDPGEAWGYSGEGFVFLQNAMETITGRSLQELAETEVFGPLEMGQSSFVWRDDFDELKATGHDVLGRPVPGLRRPESANAAASLHTTSRDYGRFLAAVLRGEGLSEESRDAMVRPASDADTRGLDEAKPHVSWGLGWGVQETEGGPSIWHWGDNGIFRAFVVGYPDLGDGLVYFANSQAGLSIAEDILALFFDDTQWAVRWLEYPRWDDPRYQAHINLREGFLSSYEDGTAVLANLMLDRGPEVEEELPGLMRFLVEEGAEESALRLAEKAVEDAPEDADVRFLLAEIQTGSRLYEEALSSYRRAGRLGSDPSEIEPRIQWLEAGLSGDGPPEFTQDELQAMAGQYGPRRVFVEDGRLRYSRDGGTPTNLIPLTGTLFALESSATFRLRFDPGPGNTFPRVLGLYSDGRTDESERTPPDAG